MSQTSLGPRPNIILFDDEPYTQPSPSQVDITKNNDVVSLLADLNKRILKIQIYEQVLRDKTHSLENRTNPLSTTQIGTSNSTHQQIINVLERKLQILVIQSNKALGNLKDEVERILTRQIMDKKVGDYESKAQIEKMEKACMEKIRSMESAHAAEIMKLQRRNQTIQQALEQRIDRIQSKAMGKIKEFERREEGFRAEIERLKGQALDGRKFAQLQRQLHQAKAVLRDLPQKQTKQIKQIEFEAVKTVTNFASTVPMKSIEMSSRLDLADKDNTSRMRRNKIFKKEEEGPSVIVTPVQTQAYQYQYSEVNSMNLLSKQLEDLTSELQLHFNPNNSGSDEDVFFYPDASKARMAPELESSTKIASPFDLN